MLDNKSKTILVVEDEKPFAESLLELLSGIGYQVTLAGNGKQGLEFYRKGNYDLVISDIMMPEMNGIELIKKIKSARPSQRILVITGVPGQLTPMNRRLAGSREDLLMLRELDFLVKPFRPQKLTEAVASVLERNEGSATVFSSEEEAVEGVSIWKLLTGEDFTEGKDQKQE